MSALQQHVPSQSGTSNISTGETSDITHNHLKQKGIYLFLEVKYMSFLLLFLFPGNSIEQVASTLWNQSLRWVRPSQSPPPGERSSMVFRTIMERTSKTLPLIWLPRPMYSYALGKERAMEWMSSELLSFQPLWVQTSYLFVFIKPSLLWMIWSCP